MKITKASSKNARRTPQDGARSGTGPLSEPTECERLEVTTHRQLVAAARTLATRVQDDPAFSIMLLANPVLALRGYGIELTHELRRHVLRSLRHPPAVRNRRETLEQLLTKELGERPRPDDPEWMARLVFETRNLAPLRIGKQQPVYRAPSSAGIVDSIRSKRPTTGRRYPGERHISVRHHMGVVPQPPARYRLDLEAQVPELPPEKRKSNRLDLEKAWFYKHDPVVRDVVELGAIMAMGFAFASPDAFRKVLKGERTNAIRNLVSRVRFPSAERA